MNDLERQLDYPLGDTLPDLGSTVDVAEGVRWLRMRLPFALDHINLWLLRDEVDGRAGWAIVDCGIDNPGTRAAWEQVFDARLDGLPVLRVIVTHLHPDHLGLAHWLCERWATPEHPCRLWMSATDYHVARGLIDRTDGVGGEAAAVFMAAHGIVDPGALQQIRERRGHFASLVPALPPHYRRLLGGDTLRIGGREWHCHVGHGHAPEHIALHCPTLGVLIAGDMVLPRISTNISVIEAEPEADPLPQFLASIERMRALPAETLVLPSHGKPFRGLHTRIDQLQAHHAERLADLMAAAREVPLSAADALPVLFRRTLDLHQTTFAMGEAIAHLNALWLGGRLTRQRGSDGVWRFSAA